jgi:hypothetical protein
VPNIQREDLTTVSLGAGNDGGVGKAKREIRVATNQRKHPLKILIAAVEEIPSRADVFQKFGHDSAAELALDQVTDFREDASRDDVRTSLPNEGGSNAIMIGISTVH